MPPAVMPPPTVCGHRQLQCCDQCLREGCSVVTCPGAPAAGARAGMQPINMDCSAAVSACRRPRI
eukprot:10286181-Lingulodinium_polyedra.AAC.1